MCALYTKSTHTHTQICMRRQSEISNEDELQKSKREKGKWRRNEGFVNYGPMWSGFLCSSSLYTSLSLWPKSFAVKWYRGDFFPVGLFILILFFFFLPSILEPHYRLVDIVLFLLFMLSIILIEPFFARSIESLQFAVFDFVRFKDDYRLTRPNTDCTDCKVCTV